MLEKFEPQNEGESSSDELGREPQNEDLEFDGTPVEHIEQLENELRDGFAEKREKGDTELSTFFHKIGILVPKGRTEYVEQLLSYVADNNIDLDKEAINSADEDVENLKRSQGTALIFGRPTLQRHKEAWDKRIKIGEATSEEAQSDLDKTKEEWGGVEFYHTVTTLIAISYIRDRLKEETIEKIRKLALKLAIDNPYVVNTVKYFSRYYDIDLETEIKKTPFFEKSLRKALSKQKGAKYE